MTHVPQGPARRPYFLISLGVLLLDQLSKWLVVQSLPGRPPRVVIPGWFNLVYSENRGGLFGYFSELADPWRTLLLTLLPLLAIVLVTIFIARGREMDRPSLAGLGLILGGAVGNLIDRVLRGAVVDFLDVYVSSPRLADWLVARFGTAHWHTFNVADSAIVAGAVLLAFSLVRPPARPRNATASGAQRAADE
jgi:signal peptidase II